MNRWLAGHVFWPLTERMLGRDTMRRYRELLRTQQASADELRDIQNRKLRRLLRHAHRHCSFHRHRFRRVELDVDDPNVTVDDLRFLPTLSKDQVREHLPEICWHQCPGGLKPYNTGGSTGRPLQFFIDDYRASADAAARFRARTWWHVRPGDVELLLWGAPVELKTNDRIRQWRDTLLNQHILNAFDLTDRSMDDYISLIQRRRPACLYGYASSLALLARHASRRWPAPGAIGSEQLQAVFVTGEVLLDRDREAIESAFGAPTAIEYGSRDGGLLALQCPAGLLHVPQENVIVELLDADGLPVEPGRVGEVVVTHLETLGMPTIRYRTGDEARGPADINRLCGCGCAAQILSEVRGRLTDHIVCRAGEQVRRMHALSLIYVLRETEGLAQFQIIQPSLDRLEVAVVADERFTPRVRRTVENRLRQRVGPDIAIEIRRQDRIPPSASGKHACVISHVKNHDVQPPAPAPAS
ncbi:MAG TPA: phenylacetate--CoA ligase family protein [Phycisphaerae bacterium]|nr:phenylacetate--CoA ligase family protein [Phycisphaerae bacterium]